MILWVIYICVAVSSTILHTWVKKINPNLTDDLIRQYLYSMKVAGWVDRVSYSGKDYYFTKFDIDPFDYAFKKGLKITDSIRRKSDVRALLATLEKPIKAVLNRVASARVNA